jgi:hypothetical protein
MLIIFNLAIFLIKKLPCFLTKTSPLTLFLIFFLKKQKQNETNI